MLSLFIDFKCPASYLAFDPTVALASHLGTRVDWHAFRSRQDRLPAERTDETRGETHRRVRAGQRRATHLKYAGLRGVEMVFRDDPGESDVALSALDCRLADPLSFVWHAFRAYWVEGADLNDAPTVLSLLEKTGNPVRRIELETAVASFDARQTQLEEDGIFITPTYRLADQMFVGREHLPLIERIMQKAVG
ncbi:MAG: DsbA family protein [Hyphomonas sp.]|nr:DsbA family protein [Hyphomonas sp.]MCB0137925.1 DsbA family protein [Caldilineaceae bacterium]MCB9971119.1 DsbA family protein [Hyphomonas sp.]